MTQMSALYPRKMIAAASDSLDKRALLESLGLDPDRPIDADEMMPSEGYIPLLERLAEADGEEVRFHLKAGGGMRCDEFGVTGLCFKSATSLAESYRRVVRYGHLMIGQPLYETERQGGTVSMKINRTASSKGEIISNEAAIATFYALSCDALGEYFAPEAVAYAHEPRRSIAPYQDHFGCPVHFGAGFNGLVISEEVAERANRVGDSALVQFFDRQLDQRIADEQREAPIEVTVREAVMHALSGGVPRKHEIAAGLAMSERTLDRRLSNHGTSYLKLLEDARRQLAQNLLAQSSYSLAEIAFMTGFSEQSAFTRAFKRWTEMTPKSFRAQGVSGLA